MKSVKKTVSSSPSSSRSSSSFEQLESRRLMSVVLPGATVALPGTTAAAQPALAGVVVRDALIPFSVDDGIGHTIFKGTLQDRVVRENGSGTLDFYQTIRADAALKSVPVVMLTSSREEQDLVRSYELGVNAYVVKPVEFSEFVEAIADLGVFWAVLNEPPPGSMRFRRVPLAE